MINKINFAVRVLKQLPSVATENDFLSDYLRLYKDRNLMSLNTAQIWCDTYGHSYGKNNVIVEPYNE
jgi:hypothetical protein